MEAAECGSGANKERLRVGIVIGSLESGGAERMALALVRALLANGNKVRLFCLDTDRIMPIPGNEEERQAIERRIITLSSGSTSYSTLRKVLTFPALHFRLEREVRNERLDLMISFMERANILNLLGRRSVPRIISIRTNLSLGLALKDPLKRLLIQYGYARLLPRATNINFNSKEAAADLHNLFPKHRLTTSVIPNFVDDDIFQRARESLPAEALALLSGDVILTCGRLLPVKGHIALIRAFTKIATAVPDAKLIILGDGPLQKQIDTLIQRLDLENRVFLPGFQKNPYAWMARCKLFVLSSQREGFPNALLEAMALDRPVVSVDCRSGPRELLAPESDPRIKTEKLELATFGVLTPPLEKTDSSDNAPLSVAEAALADAIQMLLKDDKLRNSYAEKARQRANVFRRESVLKEWYTLIDQSLPAERKKTAITL